MQKEGVFSNTVCPFLNDPEDGAVTVNGFITGDTALYTCSGLFEMKGNATRTCMSTSKWTGQPPTCQSTSGNELRSNGVYLL